MKYITFEKNEYHLKLLQEFKCKSISSFWIYETKLIDNDLSELPDELRSALLEIPEDVARASWFSHIDLSQRKTMNIKVEQQAFEWVKHTFNIPQNRVLLPRDKFTYTITEEDEKKSVEYIKAILKHYVEKNFNELTDKNKKRYQQKIENLKKQIDECNTNHDCHVLMHNNFGYAFIVLDTETKQGTTKPDAKWDITRPLKERPKLGPVETETLDSGPTIDNIDPNVFQLKWEIGEPVKIEL